MNENKQLFSGYVFSQRLVFMLLSMVSVFVLAESGRQMEIGSIAINIDQIVSEQVDQWRVPEKEALSWRAKPSTAKKSRIEWGAGSVYETMDQSVQNDFSGLGRQKPAPILRIGF